MSQQLDETVPSNALKRAWRQWKGVARKIGELQARIILTVCYFLVVAPFALVVRWATDPLAIKPGTPRGWRARPCEKLASMQRAIRQH